MSGKRCDCWDDMLNKVKEAVADKIPEGSADKAISWKDETFCLTSADVAPVNPRVRWEYRAPKKSGGHCKNMTRDEVIIAANYCAFCGRKYDR